MSEQILSQEEIDALLSAMAKGEVDLEEEKKEELEVKSYDLTSQGIMLRDQFYALEEVYDRFAGLLQNSLSSSLRRAIEVEFISTEMVKFKDFLRGFSNPTSYNIFDMEPLIGSAMLVIEPGLVFSLIDCMFGGSGKPVTRVREFTLIEQRVMRRFVVEVLQNLEKAWEVVYSVKISLKKTETKSQFIHLVAPDDLVIVVVFSVNGKEFSGNLHLCISYLMLEPIKDKFSSTYLREKDIGHTWDSRLQELLKDTQVSVTAELGRTVHTVRDLLNLQVEDVLKLNTGPQDPVTVKVEGIPKFRGLPGVFKGSRAVQITGLISQKGGINNHGYSGCNPGKE